MCKPLERLWSRLTLLSLLILGSYPAATAGIVGSLGEVRALTNESFEVDLFFAPMPDQVGSDLEFINLDVVNSNINGIPLTDFNRVMFEATGTYAAWQGLEQFGRTVAFESQISLDAFSPGAFPVTMVDTTPLLIGKFTFDYAGLGLTAGDFVTLDITGIDDGTSSRTTSVGIFDPIAGQADLFDPDFTTPTGPGIRVFTLAVATVPEPGFGVFMASFGLLTLRRKRAPV